MGLETTLQAFPESCDLIVQMRSGALDAAEVQSILLFFSWLRGNKDDVDYSLFYEPSVDEADYVSLIDSAKSWLDLDRRYLWRFCDLDRKFDVLNFLLAEYADTPEAENAFSNAICGSESFYGDVTATQGCPIMWNDSRTTQNIHEKLNSVEFGNVIRHIRSTKFREAPLYKKCSGHEYEGILHGYFCQLKEYYRLAAFNNCGTVIVVD